MINDLDVVVLTQDLPALGLKAGDIGTVVLVHGDHIGYEVEFMTFGGETVAVTTLHPDQIRRVGDGEMMHTRLMGAR